MNDTTGNGSKVSPLFIQIIGQLFIAGVISSIVIYGTVSVLGERIDNLQETLDSKIAQLYAGQMETRGDTLDIRNNYVRRAEVDPRFTRIENQVDAIYRDMARLEKKVE